MDPKINYNSAKSEGIINISKENVQTYVLHIENSQGPRKQPRPGRISQYSLENAEYSVRGRTLKKIPAGGSWGGGPKQKSE